VNSRLARLQRDERGTTLVEFALVAPALILVLVVALDFARALNAYVTITNASREAARYATVHPTASDAALQTALETFIAGRIVPLDPTRATITFTRTDWSNTADCQPACWSDSAPAPGTVVVRVRYPWAAATSMAGSFISAASGSITFDVSTAMEMLR
jgi:Flp pilus assembly protein TadG